MVTKELISQFRKRVNKNNYVLTKYRNIDGKNKWSCICSCMDWISVAIEVPQRTPRYIEHSILKKRSTALCCTPFYCLFSIIYQER